MDGAFSLPSFIFTLEGGRVWEKKRRLVSLKLDSGIGEKNACDLKTSAKSAPVRKSIKFLFRKKKN